MTFEQAYDKLKVLGQEHLLRYYSELETDEQEALLTQIETIDLSYVRSYLDRSEPELRGEISPIEVLKKEEIAAKKELFRSAGIEEAKKGSIAAVLLAGGAGTRLGTSGPKGTCNIGLTRPVYIFQRLIENLTESAEEIGRTLHLFVMTSESNDAETRAFFEAHSFFGYDPSFIHFFMQEMAPAIGEDGKILLASKSRIATAPNGNGGWFKSLETTGWLDFIRENGIEWLNVFSVDNVLQKICDPVFFGSVLTSGMPSGAKVIAKCSPFEKIGVMCLRDGRPSVVEYIELSDAMREERAEDGSYVYYYGVTLSYLFRTADLSALQDASLPVHFAHKKVQTIDGCGDPLIPEEPNAWKAEYFIFDILNDLPACLPYEVVREDEFAPIKNAVGPDSVETARELLANSGYML